MKYVEIDKKMECENCTFIKTVLMLIVVFYHSILFWNGTWYTANPVFSSSAMESIAMWLNTFHIYGFTLVSGYLFYFLKEEQGKYKRFDKFMLNKAKRLLIPYFFVMIIWVAPISYTYNEFDVKHAVRKYLLGTAPSQLWFLLMLFNVFMLMWPLSGILSRHHIGSIFLGLVFYGIGLIGGHLFPNYFQILTSCQYVIFFIAGFKLRQYGSRQVLRLPWYMWIIGSGALFYASNLLSYNNSLICKLLSIGLSFACNMIGALMAFVVLQKIAAKFDCRNNKLTNHLSKYAMPIYLFHQQFVYFFISVLNGVVNPYLNAAVNFIGSLTLSLLLSVFLMKFKITRFLIGEK